MLPLTSELHLAQVPQVSCAWTIVTNEEGTWEESLVPPQQQTHVVHSGAKIALKRSKTVNDSCPRKKNAFYIYI